LKPLPGDLLHLASIEPLAVRVCAAREKLTNAPRAAGQLEVLLAQARAGDDRARRSLLACCIAIAREDRAPWTDALARQAETERLERLGAMFDDAPPHRAIRRPGRLPDPCVAASSAVVLAGLPRHWCAPSRRLVRVERLLAHPDPAVVRRLLRAPSLQLLEALVIASRRPTTDAIVDEIVQSPRWIARIEVREALVANPFVRPRVALALLPTLLSPARRALARGSLHPIVRRAAVGGSNRHALRRMDDDRQ
jgi:hypothetical protein